MKRRDFLQMALRAGVGGASLNAVLGQMNLLEALAAPAPDYRALVCVFLYGGNDSYNMLVPSDGEEYDVYAASRQNLAIAKEALLPISPVGAPPPVGFHPSVPEIASLFESGALSAITNVGPLIEPGDKDDVLEGRIRTPANLFSHNDQQDWWMALADKSLASSGWAGRMADLLQGGSAGDGLGINVTFAGSNIWQVGSETVPYSIGQGGVAELNSVNRNGARYQLRKAALNELLALPPANVFAAEYARTQDRAISIADVLVDVLDQVPPPAVPLPGNNPLAGSLLNVARLIAARDTLGLSRQVFFVALGGWDNHGDHFSRHPAQLELLSQALGYFHAALQDIGALDDVTTFTMSDFGRTLGSNGDGSDHAWGGVQLAMGGAVDGRRLIGAMPRLEIGGPDDVSQNNRARGRMLPTIAADQFGATLAKWFGVADADLDEIFPNLENFATRDLGFLS